MPIRRSKVCSMQLHECVQSHACDAEHPPTTVLAALPDVR
jgi:hypothetical protein